MVIDPVLILLCAPGVVLVGVAKAGFGGSGTFAGTVYLSMVIGPYDAIAVMLPVLALMDLITVPAFWRYRARRDSASLLVPLLAGSLLGGALIHAALGGSLYLAIGAIAVAVALYQFTAQRSCGLARSSEFSVWRTALFGTAAGLFGVIAHAAGLALTLLLLPRALNKTTLHATLAVALAFLNLLKVPLYLGLGLFRSETLLLSAALAPFALLSVGAGIVLHRIVQQRLFERVLLVAVAAGGAKLFHSGLSELG